ncbi:MAG: type II toxin-antitoxin system Phd/YefM family antitoxin [Pirellulaceae bacterium]
MKTVSMLKFRNEAEAILKQVGRGQAFVLTYRGKPIARLEPIGTPEIRDDDPIYQLATLATPIAEPLTNKEMDRLIYGS